MIYFYIFALLLTTSPAFSFEWNAGMVSGHHQVFWARGCDFNGRDLYETNIMILKTAHHFALANRNALIHTRRRYMLSQAFNRFLLRK